MNKKAVTVTLLFAIGAAFLFMPFSLFSVNLECTFIKSLPSGLTGPVGQYVNVQGTIDTRNGDYEVWFGNNLVDSNTADGFYVNANFYGT